MFTNNRSEILEDVKSVGQREEERFFCFKGGKEGGEKTRKKQLYCTTLVLQTDRPIQLVNGMATVTT